TARHSRKCSQKSRAMPSFWAPWPGNTIASGWCESIACSSVSHRATRCKVRLVEVRSRGAKRCSASRPRSMLGLAASLCPGRAVLTDSATSRARARARASDGTEGASPSNSIDEVSAMTTSTATDLGFDSERVERIRTAIRADIDAMHYDGCVLLVARRGRIAFHEAFGFAERATAR